MDRHRVARRAPVPLRRLIVLWFAESSLDRGWRSEILGLHLEALLGALAPGSLVLLFIGFDGSAGLQASNTSIRAILLQTADIVNDDRRRLSHLYWGLGGR